MGAPKEIVEILKELVEFYPKHLEKEDEHFFIQCMNFFTKREQETMLGEFWNCDRNLIHEKYRKVVEK